MVDSRSHALGFATVAVGIVVSLVMALIPHQVYGHDLSLELLATGMLAYVVYAAALPFMRRDMAWFPGLAILAVHIGLALPAGLAADAASVSEVLHQSAVWALMVSLALVFSALWVSPSKPRRATTP